MEPAKINWESLESVFILDQIYENINAPQWVDFLALDHPSPRSGQDESWFCRSDCKHPKTAEDFLKSNPGSRLLRSVSVSKIIGFGDRIWREDNLKWRGLGLGLGQDQSNEETENENPNFSTPDHKIKTLKSKLKSSAQKSSEEHKEDDDDDEYSEIVLRIEEKSRPKLRSTQSARDLFGGKDILNKISEFCNELKKMTSWEKEKEAESFDSSSSSMIDRNPLEAKMNEIEKERKPFLEITKERSNSKKKLMMRKKKIIEDDEAENVPVSLNLNLKDIKRKDEERCLLPIRTNPPTPQGFSENRDPIKTAAKSRLMRKGDIFHEVGQNKTLKEEMSDGKTGKGGVGLDVFWFLKPCTLSSNSSV